MDRLRVLHVIWSANLGGITGLATNLCEYQRIHHLANSDLLVCKQNSTSKKSVEKAGMQIHELGLRSGADFNPIKIIKCIRLMKKYDIIHLHIFHPAVSIAALQSNKKVIYTEHGNFGLGRNTGVKGKVINRLKTGLLSRADVSITCNSRFTAHILSGINHVPENKLRVIYNGVPEVKESPKPERAWKQENEFLVVSIGRLARVKRFDRVIEAFKKAAIANSRLLIMGDGPELENLKQFTRELAARPPVEFIGSGNALDLLKQADLCLIGSQGEAFGLVATEAWQAGKRVLVFDDGGGVAEITATFDPKAVCKTVDGMAGQIRRSYEVNLFRGAEWVENAKNHAAEFSLKKMAEAFNRLYNS